MTTGFDCQNSLGKEHRMATPVYVLVLGKGYTEAWYQLSKDAQANLWAKVVDIDTRVGAMYKIVCNSRWADEATSTWMVIEYPSMETYQQAVAELEAIECWRYYSVKTILGTKMDVPGH
jgi:hypothetical protein